MCKTKQKILWDIKLEMSLMGEFGNYHLPMIATNPTVNKMLEFAIDFLDYEFPACPDVCHYIIKLKDCLNHAWEWECPKEFEAKRKETVYRLIELVWKIEAAWRFLDKSFEQKRSKNLLDIPRIVD